MRGQTRTRTSLLSDLTFTEEVRALSHRFVVPYITSRTFKEDRKIAQVAPSAWSWTAVPQAVVEQFGSCHTV